jgi:hypothetical protein
MAVGVVRAHRDERDACTGGRQEIRIGVGAAVVRHLEHVGPHVGTRRQDPLLGRGAQVTGEQHPQTMRGDPDEQAEVIGSSGGAGPARKRGQHLESRRPHDAPVPRQQDLAGEVRGAQQPVEGGHPRIGRWKCARGDQADVPAGQRPRQAAGVIGVEVGEQHQRQGVDPQPAEAAVDPGHLPTGVHEDPGAGPGGQDEGITLPDVAGDHDRPVQRPPPDRLPDRPPEYRDAHHGGERHRAQPRVAPQGPAACQEQPGQQHRTRPARGPAGDSIRDGGRPLGDQDQPAHRPSRQPDQTVGDGRHQPAEQRRHQTQHGGRRDCGGREKIGRQRHQADRPRQTGDERRGHHPGRGAHCDRVRENPRPAVPLEALRPARREHHDGRGGGDRQREPGIHGEARVEQQQHADGRRERGQRGPLASGRERDERDRAHCGRPDHARTGPREDDEAHERQPGHQRLHPAIDRPAPQRPQNPGQHDRDVRTGDGDEMGQAGPAEVGGQQRVHPPRVTDDQPGEQPRGPTVEHSPGRDRQVLPQLSGHRLHRARAAEQGRWGAGGENRDHGLTTARERGAHPDADALTRLEVLPAGGRREQQHRRVQPVGDSPVHQLRDGRVGDDPWASGRRDHVRITGQRQGDTRTPLRPGQGA